MMWLALVGCTDVVEDSGPVVEPELEGLTLEPVQACDAPIEPHWTEHEAGFTGHPDGDLEHHLGGYLAVDDFDGDGDQDVLLGFQNARWDIWWNDDSAFSVSTSWPGEISTWVPTLVDVDGDGDRDLITTHLRDPADLWINEGGAFTPGTLETKEGRRSRELVPLQLDGDGFLDLYVMTDTGAAYSSDENLAKRTDYTMRSTGLATWEVAEGDHDDGRGFDVQVVDWDGDGDDDVMVADDEGTRYGGNRLFDNQDGVLVDISVETGFYFEIAAMGLDVADVDGDGEVDVYVSAIGSSYLFQQTARQFIDVTSARGANPIVDDTEMGWAVLIRDLDNDGLPDLMTAQGDLWYEDKPGPDTVYEGRVDVLRQGSDGFTQVGPDWGFPTTGSYRTLVTWDENDDGVLDVLVGHVTGAPRLLLSDGCTEGGWLSVEAPVGSRVEVLAGDRWSVKRATHASSFGGNGPSAVHVGLGDHDVQELRVTLPDGSVAVGTEFEGRRRVTVD